MVAVTVRSVGGFVVRRGADDDKLGICICLADGVHSGVPCHYELSVDADVVNVGIVFSRACFG